MSWTPAHPEYEGEIEYFEALELAAQKLTRSVEAYKDVTKLREKIADLEEENEVLREELAYALEEHQCSSE